MTTYWLSCPQFMVLVEVNAAGTITHTAPYLRRTWLGRCWPVLKDALRQRWGTQVTVQQLV